MYRKSVTQTAAKNFKLQCSPIHNMMIVERKVLCNDMSTHIFPL